MKTKRTIFRVLSFVLLLVVMATVIFLTGCEEKATQGEVDTLKTNVASDVDTVKADLIKTQDSLNAAQSDIAKLVADLNNLAEASATKAGLTDEAAALQAEYTALDAKIAALTDAAATKAQLEADKAALQAEIDALSANAATKEALEAQKAALDTQIAALTDAAATKAQLEADKAALQAEIDALSANAATKEALEAQKAALDSQIAALTDAAATKAQLEADKAALQAQITANKQLIEGINTTIQALSSTVTSGMASLNTTIGGLSTRVSALETNSATKTELTNEVNALTQQITNINNTINSLATIEKLNEEKAALQEQINALASQETLAGEKKALQDQIDELNAIINDMKSDDALVADALYEGDYSIDKFRQKVAAVDPDNYSTDTYAAFESEANKLEFRLGRAVIVECEKDDTRYPYSVKGIFAALEDYIDNMGSLEDSLVVEMNFIENNGKITLVEGQFDKLNAIHDKMVDNNIANAEWEVTEVGQRYLAFVAARERLVNAVAAANAANVKVSALPEKDAVAYGASDAAVAEIKADYDAIKDNYFANDEMTALYGIAMDDLVGYTIYTEYQAIVDHLNDAKAALDDTALTTLEKYGTKDPLFSDVAGIVADFEALAAWAEEFELDPASDNYAAIINASKGATAGDLTRMNAVKTYAEAMMAIYEENEVAALVTNFRAEIAKGVGGVEYTNLTTLFGYYNAKDAVVALVDEDNANAMFPFTAEEKATLADMYTHAQNIATAAGKVADLNAEVAAKIDKITYTDGGANGSIQTFKNKLAAIFADDLALDHAEYAEGNIKNYNVITGVTEEENVFVEGSIKDNLQKLDTEYANLTEKVQAVYDAVKDTVADADADSLADLQKIIWARNTMNAIEVDAIIATTDFILRKNDTETITYQEFIQSLEQKLNALVALAEDAEANAVSVNAAIEALDAENFDLNDSADFKAAVDEFMTWSETYLGVVKPEIVNGENVKAYLASLATFFEDTDEEGKNNAINGITNYITGAGAYAFITKANYEALVAAADTLIDARAEAKAEWDKIVADFDKLPAAADITIHDDAFTPANNRYTDYVDTYYGSAIVSAQYDEVTAYTAFKEDYDAYLKLCEDAETLYNEIITDAEALQAQSAGVPAADAVEDIRAAANALKAKVEKYEADYCDGETENCGNQCKLVAEGVDAQLIMYQAEAKALMRKAMADGPSNADLTEATLKNNCNKVDLATTIETVVGVYGLFNSQYEIVDPVALFAPAV